MNFLQTYRRHLIFKLAGIVALILAVLSSAYLFYVGGLCKICA